MNIAIKPVLMLESSGKSHSSTDLSSIATLLREVQRGKTIQSAAEARLKAQPSSRIIFELRR
jgi:hypothetical protein